jgi:transcriptional regulator with XRE-family HTH domain
MMDALANPCNADDADRTIGANIARFRQQRGLTQADLGEALGVSHQAVHKYETGETRVAASTIVALSRRLAVPVELFFEGLDGIEANVEPHELARIQRTAGELCALREPYRTTILGIIRSLKSVLDEAAA